jgi:hypothetical protein
MFEQSVESAKFVASVPDKRTGLEDENERNSSGAVPEFRTLIVWVELVVLI